MKALDRKLIRDVLQMKGQLVAIGMVIACGVATFVMSRSAMESLQTTQQNYYDRARFAQVFGYLKRAPNSAEERIAEIPGVRSTQTRVVKDVTLDLPDLDEPAVGRLISIPEIRAPGLNELYLRQGRYIEFGHPDEVLASEGFVKAHGLEIGDKVTAIINGRKKDLEIVGIALSPEYIYQIRIGQLVPDDKRFGIFWMGREALASAFDTEGAFNDISLDLLPFASEKDVIARLDEILAPYGGFGAYGREDQISNRFVSDEIKQLRRMGLIIPSIFLGVAAFLLNVVLTRIVSLQRDQIAALKAFGYSNLAVGLHYLKMVLAVTGLGVLLGTGVGGWLGTRIIAMYTRFYRFPVLEYQLPLQVAGLALLISGAAAVIGTLNVLRVVIDLPPAEAMRPEPPALYRPTILERLGLTAFFSQPARMILRNFERRPVKSFFSTLGMALAAAILVLGRFSADALDYLVDVQFQLVQRQDVTVNFVEPTAPRSLYEIEHLPGVIRAEPFRSAVVRLRSEYRVRRVFITGLAPHPDLNHLIDDKLQPIPLPPEGLVLNTKLAELLGVGLGDHLTVEVLEGARPIREVSVTGLSTEFIGTAVYMDLDALNRLMSERDRISGAYVSSDSRAIDRLYRELKDIPRVASVTIKGSAIKSFRDTVMENLMQMQLFNVIFACIIAFGVVYNTARIALSERGRELASLRVIGFTRTEISFILLGELAVLTLLALPFGLGLGYAMARLTSYFLNTELYRIPLVIDPATYAFAVAVVMIAAVISGLVVRRKLDHLDLIAVLKTRE
jgi:putative ABC transport system permease protein